jgi:hypothetical protein
MLHQGGERVTLTLEAKASDVPIAVRLRQLLKDALRRQQLKCLADTWTDPPAPPPGWPAGERVVEAAPRAVGAGDRRSQRRRCDGRAAVVTTAAADAVLWYGWWRHRGRWQRLTGPHPGLDAAGRALDAELRRRGVRPRPRDLYLTTGAPPRAPATPRTTADVRDAASAYDCVWGSTALPGPPPGLTCAAPRRC